MTAPFSARKPLTKADAATSSDACIEKSTYKICGHLITSLSVMIKVNYKNDIPPLSIRRAVVAGNDPYFGKQPVIEILYMVESSVVWSCEVPLQYDNKQFIIQNSNQMFGKFLRLFLPCFIAKAFGIYHVRL